MSNNPVISLCLPTNGVIEWVFPVLDSIYSQNIDHSLFEVIVTNNGNNEEFHTLMQDYSKKYDNLIYKKTDAYMFANQLEALKLGNGDYLKFVNHRFTFTENSLQILIETVKNNLNEKPVIYFSNGALKENYYSLDSFDSFIKTLGKFVSWTTGVGIWKEDYKKLPENLVYDTISPHSVILFSERKKNKYIVDNFIFSKEIDSGHVNKGTYDLFKAFGVEEVSIAQKLYIDGDITAATFKSVKKEYENMVADLYHDFVICKNPCSYNLSGFNDAMGIYFNKNKILFKAWLHIFGDAKNKMKRFIKKLIKR